MFTFIVVITITLVFIISLSNGVLNILTGCTAKTDNERDKQIKEIDELLKESKALREEIEKMQKR